MKHQWYIHETSTKHPWIINKTSQLQLHPFLLGSKVPSAREVGFLWGLHTGRGALRVSTGRSSTAGQTQQAIVTWGESWWVSPTNPRVKTYSKWIMTWGSEIGETHHFSGNTLMILGFLTFDKKKREAAFRFLGENAVWLIDLARCLWQCLTEGEAPDCLSCQRWRFITSSILWKKAHPTLASFLDCFSVPQFRWFQPVMNCPVLSCLHPGLNTVLEPGDALDYYSLTH